MEVAVAGLLGASAGNVLGYEGRGMYSPKSEYLVYRKPANRSGIIGQSTAQ